MKAGPVPRPLFGLRKALLAATTLGAHLSLTSPAGAALESGVYQTLPGATAEERGDRVPNGSRVAPFSATLTFDLDAAPPSLTTVMPDAVLEGGEPFALTVRSLTGIQLTDGTYRFTGDYLRDIQPAGTQYGFDWRFSTSADGRVVWDGTTGWAGGHIWQVTIADITIVPEPGTVALIGAGLGVLGFLRVPRRGPQCQTSGNGAGASRATPGAAVTPSERIVMVRPRSCREGQSRSVKRLADPAKNGDAGGCASPGAVHGCRETSPQGWAATPVRGTAALRQSIRQKKLMPNPGDDRQLWVAGGARGARRPTA